MITNNFHIEEVTVTSHRNVNNSLPKDLLSNVYYVAEQMEKVRALLGNVPISVTSWYRSPTLNKAIGGTSKSQHLTAQAVDFICPKFGTPYEVCQKLNTHRSTLMFDQLIYEQTWIHISFAIPPMVPRLEVLTYTPEKKYVQGLKFNSIRGK